MRIKARLWIPVAGALLALSGLALRDRGSPAERPSETAAGALAPSAQPAAPVPGSAASGSRSSVPGEAATPTTGTIRGRIRPAPGRSLSPGEIDLELVPAARPIEVRDDLSFEIEHLSPGPHRLCLRASGVASIERWTRVEPGQITQLDLDLAPGVTVAGSVADEHGRPLAGIQVNGLAAPSAGKDGPASGATTDSTGRFRLGGLPAGRLRIGAVKAGFVEARADLDALPGEVREGVELVLRTGEALGGRVWLPDGKPAAGARLAIEGESSPYVRGGFQAAWDARCDAGGAFLVSGLTHGPYRVRAWMPNLDAAEEPVSACLTGAESGSLALELNLAPPGALELTVVGHGERPRGCRIEVLDLDGAATGGTPDAYFSEESRPAWSVLETTGGYRINGIESGEHVVRLTCEARKDQPLAGWTRVSVSPREATRATLALEPASLLGPIVTDEREVALSVSSTVDGLTLRIESATSAEAVLLPLGGYKLRAQSAATTVEQEVRLDGEAPREVRLSLR